MAAILQTLTLMSVLALINSLDIRVFNESHIQEWWGPKELQGREDTSIRPAKIHFDNKMIKDLQKRLRRTISFDPPLEDSGFTYGFNSDAIGYWIKYWAEEYPFKQREAYLNQFPQFKTNIQGLDIHFIHVKPKVKSKKEVIPLLILHGWAGSIREFYDAIPLLIADSRDRDFVVEVIVPCLPGFGFSDPTNRQGLGAAHMAVIMRNLMHRLGFERFYIQGGDWGGFIGSNIATIFPQEVLGFHTNWALVMSSAPALRSLVPVAPLIMEETGYLHIAATKPDTLGIALTDSPAGLLAFLLEKLSTSVDHSNRQLADGGLHNTFPPETLIDDVMFYWTTRSMATSIRLYAENFNKKYQALGVERTPTTVPTWVTQGKFELNFQPAEILKTKYQNLLNATSLDFGGHFFAMELPQVYSENVLIALKAFRAWHQTQKA
ncbi:alpha/beta hydrolase fold domain-containing protein [Phthorimaea operculella]|nr:alpha/beta hydrolase fold domain-containing protein [Phthorimaea operculella]